jgi:TatD DNase family protein
VAALDDHGVDVAIEALEVALSAPGEVAPVGLGELGLDRGRRVAPDSLPRQQRAFRAQLAMARDHDLPAVLHLVRCHGAALEILQCDGLPSAGGMVHAFSGSAETARAYAALGLHVSFSTAIARPQSRRLRAACQAVPIELLLVETDSPDQAPTPSGHGHNEPANLELAIAAVALARGEDAVAIAAVTAQNARRLFRLG